MRLPQGRVTTLGAAIAENDLGPVRRARLFLATARSVLARPGLARPGWCGPAGPSVLRMSQLPPAATRSDASAPGWPRATDGGGSPDYARTDSTRASYTGTAGAI